MNNMNNISENEVKNWLDNNLDFFEKNPDILAKISYPKEVNEKKVIDLRHFKILSMEEEIQKYKETLNTYNQISYDNLSIQVNSQEAVICALTSPSLEYLINVLKKEWCSILKVDYINVLIEPPHIKLGEPYALLAQRAGIQLIEHESTDTLLDEHDYILTPDVFQANFLFGDEHGKHVHSCALGRINLDGIWKNGIIAFGSTDSETFSEDLGTESFEFLVKIVEVCLNKWLSI